MLLRRILSGMKAAVSNRINCLRLLGAFALVLHLPQVLGGAERFVFDVEASDLEVFVPRAGLLSALGHDHTIQVTEFDGFVFIEEERPAGTELELRVPVGAMEVADPDVKESTRTKIDREMRGSEVLWESVHPEISFRATEIRPGDNETWEIAGDLTVRGLSRPVTFTANVSQTGTGAILATGKVRLRPEIFDIEPISALGGAVRTAREIELRFRIVGQREEK